MILYGTNQLCERTDARRLLALALREQYQMEALPEISLQPLGKPCFADQVGVQFNLSHSGSLALCGLDDRPVGVDIQVVKEWKPGLPSRVCSQAELDWLDRQPDRAMGFAILWSLKEAKVKQCGTGLRSQIREISVPLPERWDEAITLDGLRFRSYTGSSWAAAACGESEPPAQILWRNLD